jgi:hypothetical protein
MIKVSGSLTNGSGSGSRAPKIRICNTAWGRKFFFSTGYRYLGCRKHAVSWPETESAHEHGIARPLQKNINSLKNVFLRNRSLVLKAKAGFQTWLTGSVSTSKTARKSALWTVINWFVARCIWLQYTGSLQTEWVILYWVTAIVVCFSTSNPQWPESDKFG